MTPILYSFRRCPYAMRARMALDAAGIAVEHREIQLRDKPAAMLAASHKGTVPVLVLPDGRVLDESLDIMDWALERADPEDWRADGDREDAEAFLETFKPALDRYKYASRYDDAKARGDVDKVQRGVAMTALVALAEPLTRAPYLRGPQPRYLDIATFPFVRQFANTEPDWWAQSAPEALRTWLDSLVGSPRFTRVMAKHPLWTPEG